MELEFVKKLAQFEKRPVRLFHGTSDKFLDSILKDGLQPGTSTRRVATQLGRAQAATLGPELLERFPSLADFDEPASVFVTDGYSFALFFADERVSVDGGEPVVLELELDFSEVDSFRSLLGLEGKELLFELSPERVTQYNAACVAEGVVTPAAVDDEIDLLIECMKRINSPEKPFLEIEDIMGPLAPFQGGEWNVNKTIPPSAIKKVHREGFFTRRDGKE